MNARLLISLGCLAVFAGAGVVYLRGQEGPSPLPDSLSPSRSVRGASQSPATVRVAGLMVNSPTHTGSDPSSDDQFGVDLAFFGTFDKTRVALEIAYPAGGIIDIDSDASSITRFEDDRGTSLIKEDNHFGPFEMMPRMSEDGRYVVFVLPSDKLPYSGAKSIQAEGVAGLRIANDARKFTSDIVALEEGSSFSTGGYEFEITEVGKASWGEGFSVTLKSETDTNAILSYSLVDEKGEEQELRTTMSMSGGGSWNQTLEYDRAVPAAGFRVECWQDLKTVKVPFNIEVGLGLR